MSRLARLKQSLETLESHFTCSNQVRTLSNLDSWSAYIDSRGLTKWAEADRELRYTLISELLTYPVTLAKYIRSNPTANISTIHVVGARAEATLPPLYWAQLLNEVNVSKIDLHFFGPDIPDKIHGKTETIECGTAKSLKRSFGKAYYDLSKQAQPDVAVFFNPGFSHEKLRAGWKPTLEALLKTDIASLVTGLNEHDAVADCELVRQTSGRILTVTNPVENTLASMKEHSEGLTGRFARANHFVWHWNSKP